MLIPTLIMAGLAAVMFVIAFLLGDGSHTADLAI